jgi:TPR repeat protein
MGGDRATASAFARDPVACHHEARAPPRRPVVTAPWRDALDRLADDPGAALEALEAAAPDDAEAALTLALLLLEADADDEAGIYWLASAAQAGARGSRQLLARALLQGRVGGRPQPREAVRVLLLAARGGEVDALRDLVELALLLDDALLFDAALGLTDEPEELRRAFVAAIIAAAPDWYETFGDDLGAALRLD